MIAASPATLRMIASSFLVDDTVALRSRIQRGCRHTQRILSCGRKNGWLPEPSFPVPSKRGCLDTHVNTYCALHAPRASSQAKREMVKKLERLYDAVEAGELSAMLTEVEECMGILMKIEKGPEWVCALAYRASRSADTSVEDLCRLQGIVRDMGTSVMRLWPASEKKED
jgi:hypothetical protein